FADLLHSGRNPIRHIPDTRISATVSPEFTATQKYGLMSAAIDCFDARFFRVSPREAELMDPQQRLCLETVWEAVEDSHCGFNAFTGSDSSIAIGANRADFMLSVKDCESTVYDSYFLTGTFLSVLSGRISYYYNLSGPSTTVDTACSSSLVALHEAVRNMIQYKLSSGLAGGTVVMMHPLYTLELQKIGAISPDMCCKSFDSSANGYCPSEGTSMILLTAESTSREQIAVSIKSNRIRINHDGASGGLTVPNGSAQRSLLTN
ncbi:MAG: polyketide synthase, partial [Desulfobacteraceae bacterium]|nr:polyketide synthase [Desulfobacteraceae bacterium]